MSGFWQGPFSSLLGTCYLSFLLLQGCEARHDCPMLSVSSNPIIYTSYHTGDEVFSIKFGGDRVPFAAVGLLDINFGAAGKEILLGCYIPYCFQFYFLKLTKIESNCHL